MVRRTASTNAAKPLPSGATSAELLRLDRQLCFALYAASLAMTKLYQPLLANLGLTYPQYLVMLVLWESGELSVGELGERLSLDSGTLTPLLKRLEAAGLLLRRRDSDDERRVLASLTPAGSALREQALCVPQQVLAATAVPAAEVSALAEQLHRLRASVLDAAATLSPPAAATPAAASSDRATAKETPWPRPKRSSTPPTPRPPAAAKARRSPTTARSTSS